MKTIEEIRKAFLAMHHYATKENAPTYMSVPADRNRDADLILSAAIDELEKLRSEVIAAKADAARLRETLQKLLRLSGEYAGNSDNRFEMAHNEMEDELSVALSATDSAAWLESKIAERTAQLTSRISELEAVSAAAKSSAAHWEQLHVSVMNGDSGLECAGCGHLTANGRCAACMRGDTPMDITNRENIELRRRVDLHEARARDLTNALKAVADDLAVLETSAHPDACDACLKHANDCIEATLATEAAHG